MKSVFSEIAKVLLGAAASIAGLSSAYAGPLGPTPYLSFAASPFSGGTFSYFNLETFEDGLLNTPGVTASAGGVTSVVFGPTAHDSVDADDGVIDGSGLSGDSYFSGSGAAGISFTFNAGVLGALPDSVGIVWTDGDGTTTFQAFDAANVLLGTIGPVAIATPGSFFGQTDEDRFFGFTNSGGISRIFISNTSGGIEVDHLQYGLTSSGPGLPEPATLALLGAALAGLAFFRRGTK
jgi:hypothetical protein